MTAIDQLRERVADRAVELARRAADLTVQRTQEKTSRRTGELADGISHDEPALSESRVSCTIVSAAPYSQFQNEGTGTFGPTGQRIFPRTAKALRFDWSAAGGIVFAKSVAGSPGTHFWDDMASRWRDALAESIQS